MCQRKKVDPARDQVLQFRGEAAIGDEGEPGPGFFLLPILLLRE
jgi:hypothetical protein